MDGRVVAVDAARGVAVLGMFAAHLGVKLAGELSPGWLMVADGRPSAAFAILAGVSIALFTGRSEPPRGEALVRGWLRVLSRAGIIFILGLALELLGTPIAIILPSYAVAFVLVTPAIGAGPRLAGGLALLVAVLAPLLLALATTERAGAPGWAAGALGDSYLMSLLLTGNYPALVWSAYLLLGLAVGRLPLRAARTQAGLGIAGAVFTVGGYGGGAALLAWLGDDAGPVVRRLLSVEPHADSTFELLGNTGVFLLVLACLLWLTTSPVIGRAARWLLTPVIATGQVALSAYSGHVVTIALLAAAVVREPTSNVLLVVVILATLLVCPLWVRWLGRGPLERLLRALSVGGEPDRSATAPPPVR